MIPDREELVSRVSAVMDELNSLCLAAHRLGTLEGNAAKDKLGRAWSHAYDARRELERVPVL